MSPRTTTHDNIVAHLVARPDQSINQISDSTVTLLGVVPLDKEKPLPPIPGRKGDLSGLSTALGAYVVTGTRFHLVSIKVNVLWDWSSQTGTEKSMLWQLWLDFYTQHYLSEHSSSAISWIGSTNAFLFEITGLIAGRLHDRGYLYGPCYHLVIGGSLLQVFSLFMLSFAKPGQFYQIFLSQGIGSGIAAGLVFIPSLAVLSHHFDKHLATMMAIVTSGSSLGGAIHPIMLNNTINGRLALPMVSARARVSLMPPSDRTSFFVSAKKCMHDSAYLFCVAGGGLLLIFTPYLQLVIMNSSSAIAQLFAGLLATIIGLDMAMIFSSFGAAAVVFGMIGISTVSSVVAVAVLYGCFSGIVGTLTVFALIGPMLTLLTPDLSELGVRLSLPGVMFGLGGLIGPPISGALLTDQYIWYRGAVFNGTLAAVGAILLVIMKVILDRRTRYSLGYGDSLESLPSSEGVGGQVQV
ncbi:hypothetical protein BU15DRAFT_64711 [Melanogaster broomeanus]|nr:hypothetical protein BU15DRAFT_64711 [Melanogaster broomeanus]